ncbi:MAG: isovaleryl-CoA dehydrogenase [Myxococcales bacterium]|nr:isovaleryl-CoA dehydrogenase [Myxococcales bacterium]MCB9536778.1 isovaleryl-CoA dehydrogenase [Myxococcales bacterium]
MKTHDVINQVPPLRDYDMFSGDTALAEALVREGAGWATDALRDFGQLTGSAEMLEHGRLANDNPPILRAFDAYGHRINEVEFHPSYHHLMETSMAFGLHSRPWTEDRAGSMVARVAHSYLMGQVEAGHGCPITMTFAVVPALQHAPELAETWVPRLTATAYDPRNTPAEHKTACTAGMAMTEKQGGSDVRANTTQALAMSDGTYRLTGHKWFCSAPMCDVFLTLAQTEKGLTCFLVPRWTPDGERNAMHVQRLKWKLGNHSNASSEIEYAGAWAARVGEEGRGVRTIIDMVAHTRLDCVIGSASLMRQAVARAVHHTDHRRAFGKRLIEHALMKNVLADLALESEAAMALGLRLARAYDEGKTDAGARAFARIATAVSKYWVCKRCPATVYEALECTGGNGYAEEFGMARLYREAPLNSVWEGSGNVICLDVLRAMKKDPESLPALQTELGAALGKDRRYDGLVAELEGALRQTDTLELRARAVVEKLALALQASILIRHAPDFVADAFVTSRLGERHANFGALGPGLEFDALIERAHPLAP